MHAPPQSHIKEIVSHNFLKSRDVKLDISKIKNLYKVKHPLKCKQLVKRKKIHSFILEYNSHFWEFQKHYFKRGYLSFLVKVEGLF